MNKALHLVMLIKPREQLSVRHFLLRVPIYAAVFFAGHRIFVSQVLLSNVLVSLIVGLGMVGVEYFFFAVTGGRSEVK